MLEITFNLSFYHQFINELDLVLVVMLAPVHFLDHYSNAIDAKCKHSAGNEHGDVRTKEFNVVFRSDIAVSNCYHCHCCPIKR